MAVLVHVEAIRDFYDMKDCVDRKAGDAFDVTKSRLKELNACGQMQCFEPLVEVVEEPEQEADGE